MSLDGWTLQINLDGSNPALVFFETAFFAAGFFVAMSVAFLIV